ERYITSGDERPRPHWEILVYRPRLFPLDGIPGHEFPAIAAWASVHVDRCTHEWRAGDIADCRRFDIHAQVLVRNVEELGPRGPRRRLPVLCTRCRRAHLFDGLVESGRLFLVVDWPAGFEVN